MKLGMRGTFVLCSVLWSSLAAADMYENGPPPRDIEAWANANPKTREIVDKFWPIISPEIEMHPCWHDSPPSGGDVSSDISPDKTLMLVSGGVRMDKTRAKLLKKSVTHEVEALVIGIGADGTTWSTPWISGNNCDRQNSYLAWGAKRALIVAQNNMENGDGMSFTLVDLAKHTIIYDVSADLPSIDISAVALVDDRSSTLCAGASKLKVTVADGRATQTKIGTCAVKAPPPPPPPPPPAVKPVAPPAPPAPPAAPAMTKPAVPRSSIPVQNTAKTDVPPWASMRGADFVSAKSFTDKNGENVVVFSSTRKVKSHDDWAEYSYDIYVDHWALAKGKDTPKSLLPARDNLPLCQYALAGFIDSAFTATDLDSDGYAEITYAYQLSCSPDAEPATFKLLLVENGKKHILRGFSVMRESTYCVGKTTGSCQENRQKGGTFVPEPVEAKWEDKFYKRAVDVWNATASERP